MNIVETVLNPLSVLKIGFLVIDLFYIIFLLILLDRIKSMSKIVREEHDAVVLRSVAVFKILASISLFLLALAVL